MTDENAGHVVLRVCDFPDNPSDEQILALALREDRIVVTVNKDFGELAVAFGLPQFQDSWVSDINEKS